MPVPELIERYLDRHHLAVQHHDHRPTYTAHQLAEVEHVPETAVAKVVIFFFDEWMGMAVVPANRHLNFHLVKHLVQARELRLATEWEIGNRFENLPPGAIPPFGSMFGLPVFLDAALMESAEIEIPGGEHTHSLTMRLVDFMHEESPRVAPLTRSPIHHKPHPEHRHLDYF